MSARAPRIEFAVGAFLLLALASLVVLALASTNGKLGFGQARYPLTAHFANIGQLRPDAPVRIAGVNVGEVSAIRVDPLRFDAVVTLMIDDRYDALPVDTAASIQTSGLLGESFIALQPGGAPDVLKPGGEITFTQSAIDLLQLVGKYMFSGGGKPDASPAPAPAGSAAPTTGTTP
jgi:phospholipid/cholesterol/gamma-HCH transport system substrate-binding protein